MEQAFRADVRYLSSLSMALDMQGDLTKQAEQSLLLMRPWQEGLDEGRTYLILNLTQVPYINSAGIAVLIRLSRAGAKGGFLTFGYGITPHYEKLFRMVGLTEYLTIYPDEHAIIERIAALDGSP